MDLPDQIPPDDDRESTETFDSISGPRSARPRIPPDLPGLVGFGLMSAAGPRRGMYWSLDDGPNLAGRNPEAMLVLDDVSVSREHAQFDVSGDRLTVRDLGSTNGTYVNGHRLDEAELTPGDEVIIGRFHLIVARGS